MNEVLVIGHRNPDTDAICSALAYAEFKRRTGLPEAVAARCGELNGRIDFVLRTFGVAPPKFVADVSPKVRDVMHAEVFSVRPGAVAAEALALMDEHNVRVLPVLDDERRCRGLLSLFKLSQFLFPCGPRLVDSRRILASLTSLADTLGGELLVAERVTAEEDLMLMIGAMGLESFAERLERFPRDQLVVVVGDRWDIQNLAIREHVRCMVVTGGHPLEPKTLEAARRNRVAVISSPHDTATTAALCRASLAVRHVLDEQFVAFRDDAPLAEARRAATRSPQTAFPVVDEEGRTVGMLSKSDFLKKVDRRLILVDHNELAQAVPGADLVEILEIIDHHRIGSLTTAQPILFRNEPVGSTSTIVADCYFRNSVELPAPIAGLLLAGLVADTLNLTSPTTTTRDREVLWLLEQVAGVNARAFTDQLFASGSVLTTLPAARAIASDSKEYQHQGAAFRVAQIEEVGFDQFWRQKDDLLAALDAERASKGFHFCALFVTDVVRQTSLLLVAGDPSFIRRVDYPQLQPGVFELRDVVSRKKQLLPYLTELLDQMRTESA